MGVVVAVVASGTWAQGPPPVPGKVTPHYPQTYNMTRSTAIMICNSTGPVDAEWAARWWLVDIDWNSDKV